MELDRNKQLGLYETMVRIRLFEEKAIEVFHAGKIPGFIHSYIGEEAVAAGVCAALHENDYITSTHRGHGHCLARGMRPDRMFAELFGKASGYNKGKGGSMHIADFSRNVLGASGIVGGGIPIATGAAWASQVRGTDQVAVTFFGDGATNRGAFHEALNMAAIWSLPVVYVCEDNGWAISVPTSVSIPIPDISRRAASYGFPGVSVDGNDVLAVHATADEAVRRARRGEGPTLLVCRTARQRGHDEGDPQTYRPKSDIDDAKAKDPLPRFRQHLLSGHLSTEAELAALERSVHDEIEAAAEVAEKSPYPSPEEALQDVFAGERQ